MNRIGKVVAYSRFQQYNRAASRRDVTPSPFTGFGWSGRGGMSAFLECGWLSGACGTTQYLVT